MARATTAAKANVSARARGSRRAKPSDDPRRMAYRDVADFLRALRGGDGSEAAKDALEWLILTVTRTNATLGARFKEVNEKSAVWTVPAARTQPGEERVIPLPTRALEILATRRKRHSGKGDFLFESSPGEPLNSAAMLMEMRRLKLAAIPHGFRYSFNDWANETAKEQKAAAWTALEARRKLLDDWAAFCGSGKRGKR